MSDDLRDLMKEAAADPSKPLVFGDVLQGGARLRRRRRVASLGMALLAGFAAWSSAGALNDGGESTQRTPVADGGFGSTEMNGNSASSYSFSEVVVNQTGPHAANVNFEYEWTTQEFPGLAKCTFTVNGANGEVVGERTRQVGFLMPSGRFRSDLRVTVSGVASSAAIVCGHRLDDPNGNYILTNVRVVEPKEPGVDESREVLIKAEAEWKGQGTTVGVAECRIVAFGDDGQEVLAETTTFSAEIDENEPIRTVEFSLTLPKGAQRPSSVDVDCTPFRG